MKEGRKDRSIDRNQTHARTQTLADTHHQHLNFHIAHFVTVFLVISQSVIT